MTVMRTLNYMFPWNDNNDTSHGRHDKNRNIIGTSTGKLDDDDARNAL